jgi:hypothetical protein
MASCYWEAGAGRIIRRLLANWTPPQQWRGLVCLGPGEIATSLNRCLVVLRRWRSTSSLVVLVMRGDYSSPGEHGSRVGFSLRSGPSRASGEGPPRRGRNRPLANARTDDKCRDHGLACPERPDPSVGVLVGVLVGPFLGRPLRVAQPCPTILDGGEREHRCHQDIFVRPHRIIGRDQRNQAPEQRVGPPKEAPTATPVDRDSRVSLAADLFQRAGACVVSIEVEKSGAAAAVSTTTTPAGRYSDDLGRHGSTATVPAQFLIDQKARHDRASNFFRFQIISWR